MKLLFSKLILLIFIFSMHQSFALPVDIQKAGKAATQFYISMHPQADKIMEVSVSFIHTDLCPVHQTVMFYAVNFSDTGFVVISGDDAVSPVLAYSFTSFFTGEDMPLQLSGLLEEYRNLINHIRFNESGLTMSKTDEWDALIRENFSKSNRAIVDPLIPCTWDQGAHYNMLCPEDTDGPGGRVYAGCVATAMSMVMYHFRYPDKGQGQSGYNSNYGYLHVDFSQSDYNWNEMPTRLLGKNFPVAKLMYDCGVAVDMMYSPNGSGAYMNDAAYAMHAYFKYSPSLSLVYRNDYSFSAWTNLLKGQLDQGFPLMYAGYGSNGPGHAFICDGYDSGNMFHFNWGWSGAYNGFYLMDYLTPGGYSFSNWQQAVINCYPADNNYPYGCSGGTVITGKTGTITDGSGPGDYANNSDCSWLIQPDILTETITLKFHRFNTESGADQVCVYDGPDNTFPLLGCFSGSNIPADLTSSGGSMFVAFQSDAATTGKGFFAEFTSVPMKFCETLTVLTDPSGTIEDGSDQYSYQPNTLCRWLITPPDAGAIIFEFVEFDTEPENDYVVLLDNSTFPSTEIVRFSGSQIPDTYVYYGSPVILMFKTDDYNQLSGWKINYSTWAVTVDEFNISSVQVYPNPFTDIINISDAQAGSVITLYDIAGRKVYSERIEVSVITHSIAAHHLPDGIYTLQVFGKNGTEVSKLVKVSSEK